MKEPLLGFFIVKLQPGIAYEKAKVKDTCDQLYQKEMPTQGLLHKNFPAGFEKVMNTNLNTSARLPLK